MKQVPTNIKIKWGSKIVKLPDHNSRVTLTGDLAGVEIWGKDATCQHVSADGNDTGRIETADHRVR